MRRAATGVLLVVLALLLPAAAATADPRPTRVVVVGVPGLRWDDVTPTDTPTLWRLAQTAAVGALSVKAGPAVSCAADGFLTLGAGARATAYGARCGGLPPDPAAVEARNRRSRERADPTALDTALRAAGTCARAQDAMARLALPLTEPTGPCPVTVSAGPPVTGTGTRRATTASAADRFVATQLGGPGTTVLILGLSETPTEQVAHLHVALAAGPGFDRGALSSASTGRPRYVQLIDVAPTVLHLVGLPAPSTMTGQSWHSGDAAPTVATLRDLDRRAVEQKAATVPFFVAALAIELVLLLALLLSGRRPAARAVALAGAALPGASFLAGLVPWWRTGAPLVALLAVSIAVAVATAALALLAGRSRYPPVAAVGGLTALVLVADLTTGAHLQITSVTGYSPLVAGRFAGLGNVAFGVYAASGLLALGRLRHLPLLLAGGAVLLLVDGSPSWGSDVGGVLALLPALAVLVLLVTGRRLSVPRLAAAAAAGVLLVAVLALVDHARPAGRRTHLGRFVDQVQDGTAGDVLQRKAAAVFGLLFHSPVTALLPLVVVAAVVLVRRPPPPLAAAFQDEPAFRSALVATGVASALGFALNDSGAAVPALALVVLIPATVAFVSGRRAVGPGR